MSERNTTLADHFASPPTFFVVGAQKAGTSALHAVMQSCAAVSLPAIKETSFFCTNERFERGFAWYRSWFEDDGPGRVCGEVDPRYLFTASAGARIAEHVPDARIVIVLREPLSRALSHHRMTVQRTLEDLRFEEALAAEAERLRGPDPDRALLHHGYLALGLYHAQVRRYFDLFPRENVLVERFEDLTCSGDDERRRATLDRILRHVGIRAHPSVAISVERNAASAPRYRVVSRMLHRDSRFKRLLRPVLPLKRLRLRLAMAVDRLNRVELSAAEPLDPGRIPPSTLRAVREDVRALQDLLELDLSEWLSTYPVG